MPGRALALMLAALLVAPSLAAAQGGGSGFGRQSRFPKADEGANHVGKYSLWRADVHHIVDTPEARPALAAFEAAVVEAERRGQFATAARAGAAAVIIANRFGMLDKLLTLGPRVIELGLRAPRGPEVIRAVLEVSATVSRASRNVNDQAVAHKVLVDADAFSRTPEVQLYRRSLSGAMASIRGALSSMEFDRGALAAALSLAQEAVQISSESLEHVTDRNRRGVNRGVTRAFLHLARMMIKVKRPDDASAALTKAAEHAHIAGSVDLVVDVGYEAAQLALDRSAPHAALKLARTARAEAERVGLSRVGQIDRVIAQAHAVLGDAPAALVAVRSALDRMEKTRADLQDSSRRAGFLEQRQGLYAFAVDLALRVNKPADGFELAERARSRAFLDLIGSAALSKGRTHALAQEESALRARLAEATALARDPGEDEGVGATTPRVRLEAVEREYQAFLVRVRRESGEQASLMAVEPVTVAEIQTLLPPDTVLVEYMVARGEVVVWLVDKATVQVRRVPFARELLVRDVREFRAAIADGAPLADVEARATALHRTLVGPAQAALAGKRLLVVPHDVLHYLPFGALRTPQGRWFVEDHAIATVPSASVLKFLVDKGTQRNDRVLAVGNPELGPALALRYAEYEVRAIRDRYPSSTTLLTQAGASEHRVKREVGAAGLIHFAVHGELNEEDPMASALLLVPGDGEDGRLQVRELFATELNARLVVLAACETGLGKLSRGDELVGLQRAFLYAGTPTVLTTLWKVDDRASYVLMRTFYEQLAAKGATEALRMAQRALMATFPHPYSWAAFSVTGAAR